MALLMGLDLTCGVCKEIFTNPKLLPCFHTFCLNCLVTMESLADQQPLRCPTCRSSVTLPEGGVTKLQSNFYITPWLTQELCREHVDHRLELYCKQDNSALCVLCKLTKHDKHEVEDLSKVLPAIRKQLADSAARLLQHQKLLEENLPLIEKKASDRKNTMKQLEDLVRKRELILTDKIKAESKRLITELKSHHAEQLTRDQWELQCTEERITTIHTLIRQTYEAQKSASSQNLLDLNENLLTGTGLTSISLDLPPAGNPLLLYVDSYIQNSIANYLGHWELRSATVNEVFRCGDGDDNVVHALCVLSTGYVVVALHCGRGSEDGYVSKFTHEGHSGGWDTLAVTGRVSLCELQGDVVRVEGKKFPPRNYPPQLYVPSSDDKDSDETYDVYSKGSVRFVLRVSTSGDCQVRSVQLDQQGETSSQFLFTVEAKEPLAMDASKDGEIFAVLEKEQSRVRLYRRGHHQPYAVYHGNEDNLEMTDVCFYSFNEDAESERLVVADRTKDLLHVLDVQESCTLVGKIGNCPDLVKPTAVCAGPDGRLWIGCEGGRILRNAMATVC